jgi:hypothetical protein
MDELLAIAELQAALSSAPKSVSSMSLILSALASASGLIDAEGEGDVAS